MNKIQAVVGLVQVVPKFIIGLAKSAAEYERTLVYFDHLCKGLNVSQSQSDRVIELTKKLSNYNGLSPRETLDCIIRGMLGFDLPIDNAYLYVNKIKQTENSLNKYHKVSRHKVRAVAIIQELERQVNLLAP